MFSSGSCIDYCVNIYQKQINEIVFGWKQKKFITASKKAINQQFLFIIHGKNFLIISIISPEQHKVYISIKFNNTKTEFSTFFTVISISFFYDY